MLHLHLGPDEAWAARFADLASALGLYALPPAVPGRAELAGLMRRYPDAAASHPKTSDHRKPR